MTEYLINIKTIMKCRSPTTRPMGDLQNDGSIGIKRTSVTNWQQKAMVRTKWKELGEVYIQQRIQAGWRSRNGMVFGFLIKNHSICGLVPTVYIKSRQDFMTVKSFRRHYKVCISTVNLIIHAIFTNLFHATMFR